MEIYKTQSSEGIVTIRVKGKCVAANINSLKTFMEELPEPGKYQIVLSLMNINIIDSYAVGFLMETFDQINKKGGQFKLCNAKPLIKRLLEAADVDRLLEIYDTEGEAVASIRETPQEV